MSVPASGELPAGYRVERVLGVHPGLDALYRAIHPGGGTVALRVYTSALSADPAFRAEFANAVRIQSALEHPQLVRVRDSSLSPGHAARADADEPLFVAVALVDGATLAERVAYSPLSIGAALSLARSVGGALDAAAEAGVVHRRLGARAILLDDDDVQRPVLTDLGVGWSAAGEPAGPRHDPGRLLGDAHYLAPEEVRGQPPNARSNVYALAAIIFECLAGRPPYTRDSHPQLLFAHLCAPPPQLAEQVPHVPRQLGAALARAMAKAPDERPSSAGELVTTLEGALTH